MRRIAILALAFVAVTLMMFFCTRETVCTPLSLPGHDLVLTPESERMLQRIIIGLETNRTQYFMLPSTETFDLRSMDPSVRFIRRQSYWLNFELVHGRLLEQAPPYSEFYIAVPDPKFNTSSMGNEEEVFIDYLKTRLKWSDEDIARRVHFFHVPVPLLYPQDMAEVLGYDSKGRLVLGYGESQLEPYPECLKLLEQAFPDEFSVRMLGEGLVREGLDMEGGDLAIVWLPEGSVGLLLGRHRVLRLLEVRHSRSFIGVPVTPEDVAETRALYQRAFYGIETIVAGEQLLYSPELVGEELFHLDMTVNVLRNGNRVTAFIPTYPDIPTDSVIRTRLGEELHRRVQHEYDEVARQLGERGYRIARLPFNDQPVRNPVNVGFYVDPETHQQVVLLGKYPYHFDLPDGTNPQYRLQDAFNLLYETVSVWREDPSASNWAAVEDIFATTWEAMDIAADSPNPTFDEQVRVYESEGIKIVPVPIFPTGEGGLHCMVLK